MQPHRFSLRVLVSVVALVAGGLAAGGCGREARGVKVTGSVTMGGQPQEGARVFFISTDPKGDVPPRAAVTQADGKFAIEVLPGNYKVTLTKWVDKAGKVPGASEDPTQDFTQLMESGALKQVFPAQYADQASTPITTEIPASGKDLEPFAIDA